MSPHQMNNSSSKQQLNIYLPPSLVISVKHAAIDMDVSLSAFVEAALKLYLEQIKENASKSNPEN
jgi:hypothetical protein